jgi:hypothetical protein
LRRRTGAIQTTISSWGDNVSELGLLAITTSHRTSTPFSPWSPHTIKRTGLSVTILTFPASTGADRTTILCWDLTTIVNL